MRGLLRPLVALVDHHILRRRFGASLHVENEEDVVLADVGELPHHLDEVLRLHRGVPIVVDYYLLGLVLRDLPHAVGLKQVVDVF